MKVMTNFLEINVLKHLKYNYCIGLYPFFSSVCCAHALMAGPTVMVDGTNDTDNGTFLNWQIWVSEKYVHLK